MKYALQLYTVRDSYSNAEEYKSLLKEVKEIGFDGVEFAGFGGLSVEELKSYIAEIGLVAVSSHHTITELEERKEDIMKDARALGCNKVVCSFSDPKTKEELDHVIAIMKECIQLGKEYNIAVGYHNHTHEIVNTFDGVSIMEVIEETCLLEVDTYWVFNGKLDPVTYIKDRADQIILLHIKDGDLEGHPCALGEGHNNIKGILDAAEEIGMEWVIVENDNPVPDGMGDITRSMNYLKSLYQI